jgi:hypothetical protein
MRRARGLMHLVNRFRMSLLTCALPLPVPTPAGGVESLASGKTGAALPAAPPEGVSCASMAQSAGFKVWDAPTFIDMIVSVASLADQASRHRAANAFLPLRAKEGEEILARQT